MKEDGRKICGQFLETENCRFRGCLDMKLLDWSFLRKISPVFLLYQYCLPIHFLTFTNSKLSEYGCYFVSNRRLE